MSEHKRFTQQELDSFPHLTVIWVYQVMSNGERWEDSETIWWKNDEGSYPLWVAVNRPYWNDDVDLEEETNTYHTHACLPSGVVMYPEGKCTLGGKNIVVDGTAEAYKFDERFWDRLATPQMKQWIEGKWEDEGKKP